MTSEIGKLALLQSKGTQKGDEQVRSQGVLFKFVGMGLGFDEENQEDVPAYILKDSNGIEFPILVYNDPDFEIKFLNQKNK